MAFDFTLEDLKNPRWTWNIGGTPYAIDYEINGQEYFFMPEELISQGVKSGDTQKYFSSLLNPNALETIFTEGALIDLEGIAPEGRLKTLEKSGLGSKGVLVPKSVTDSVGAFSTAKQYEIDPNSRTKGEILGLSKIGDEYVYLKQPQGDRAGLTYTNSQGRTRAEYTKVRGGILGEALYEGAKSFAGVPLLPEIVGAITGNPYTYAGLKSLQTAGQGGDLLDVAKSGIKAFVGSGGLQNVSSLPAESLQAIETLTAVAGEEDPLQAFIKQYGVKELNNALEGSDFANYAKSSITDVVGADTVSFLEDNIDYVKAGKDILIEGKDPSEVLADRFGSQIVSGLGAESPTERALAFAGLKTGVALDQGASDRDALFAGAQEYFERGGELPDVNAIASISGVDPVKFDLGEFGIDIPDLPFDLDLREVVGKGFNLSGIPFPELQARGFDISNIGDLGLNVGDFDFQGFKPGDFGDFNVNQLADLGVDLVSLDFGGMRPGDIGDFSLPELRDMGIDIGSLDITPELAGLGVAVLGAQEQQQREVDEEELVDGMAQFQSEFEVPLDEPSFAREVLGRRFT